MDPRNNNRWHLDDNSPPRFINSWNNTYFDQPNGPYFPNGPYHVNGPNHLNVPNLPNGPYYQNMQNYPNELYHQNGPNQNNGNYRLNNPYPRLMGCSPRPQQSQQTRATAPESFSNFLYSQSKLATLESAENPNTDSPWSDKAQEAAKKNKLSEVASKLKSKIDVWKAVWKEGNTSSMSELLTNQSESENEAEPRLPTSETEVADLRLTSTDFRDIGRVDGTNISEPLRDDRVDGVAVSEENEADLDGYRISAEPPVEINIPLCRREEAPAPKRTAHVPKPKPDNHSEVQGSSQSAESPQSSNITNEESLIQRNASPVRSPNNAIQEDLKRKVLTELMTMSAESMAQVIENPKLNHRLNVLMPHLVQGTSCILSQKLRGLAELKMATRENFKESHFLDEVQSLIDTDLAVDLCSLPPELIKIMSEVFKVFDPDPDEIQVCEDIAEAVNTSMETSSSDGDEAPPLPTRPPRPSVYFRFYNDMRPRVIHPDLTHYYALGNTSSDTVPSDLGYRKYLRKKIGNDQKKTVKKRRNVTLDDLDPYNESTEDDEETSQVTNHLSLAERLKNMAEVTAVMWRGSERGGETSGNVSGKKRKRRDEMQARGCVGSSPGSQNSYGESVRERRSEEVRVQSVNNPTPSTSQHTRKSEELSRGHPNLMKARESVGMSSGSQKSSHEERRSAEHKTQNDKSTNSPQHMHQNLTQRITNHNAQPAKPNETNIPCARPREATKRPMEHKSTQVTAPPISDSNFMEFLKKNKHSPETKKELKTIFKDLMPGPVSVTKETQTLSEKAWKVSRESQTTTQTHEREAQTENDTRMAESQTDVVTTRCFETQTLEPPRVLKRHSGTQSELKGTELSVYGAAIPLQSPEEDSESLLAEVKRIDLALHHLNMRRFQIYVKLTNQGTSSLSLPDVAASLLQSVTNGNPTLLKEVLCAGGRTHSGHSRSSSNSKVPESKTMEQKKKSDSKNVKDKSSSRHVSKTKEKPHSTNVDVKKTSDAVAAKITKIPEKSKKYEEDKDKKHKEDKDKKLENSFSEIKKRLDDKPLTKDKHYVKNWVESQYESLCDRLSDYSGLSGAVKTNETSVGEGTVKKKQNSKTPGSLDESGKKGVGKELSDALKSSEPSIREVDVKKKQSSQTLGGLDKNGKKGSYVKTSEPNIAEDAMKKKQGGRKDGEEVGKKGVGDVGKTQDSKPGVKPGKGESQPEKQRISENKKLKENETAQEWAKNKVLIVDSKSRNTKDSFKSDWDQQVFADKEGNKVSSKPDLLNEKNKIPKSMDGIRNSLPSKAATAKNETKNTEDDRDISVAKKTVEDKTKPVVYDKEQSSIKKKPKEDGAGYLGKVKTSGAKKLANETKNKHEQLPSEEKVKKTVPNSRSSSSSSKSSRSSRSSSRSSSRIDNRSRSSRSRSTSSGTRSRTTTTTRKSRVTNHSSVKSYGSKRKKVGPMSKTFMTSKESKNAEKRKMTSTKSTLLPAMKRVRRLKSTSSQSDSGDTERDRLGRLRRSIQEQQMQKRLEENMTKNGIITACHVVITKLNPKITESGPPVKYLNGRICVVDTAWDSMDIEEPSTTTAKPSTPTAEVITKPSTPTEESLTKPSTPTEESLTEPSTQAAESFADPATLTADFAADASSNAFASTVLEKVDVAAPPTADFTECSTLTADLAKYATSTAVDEVETSSTNRAQGLETNKTADHQETYEGNSGNDKEEQGQGRARVEETETTADNEVAERNDVHEVLTLSDGETNEKEMDEDTKSGILNPVVLDLINKERGESDVDVEDDDDDIQRTVGRPRAAPHVNNDISDARPKIIIDPVYYRSHTGRVFDLKLLGKHLLTASEDKLVYCYSVVDGKRKRVYSGHTDSVTCLAVINKQNKSGAMLFSGCLDGYLRLFAIKNSRMLRQTPYLGGPIQCLVQDWGIVFAGLANGTVAGVNAKTLKSSRQWEAAQTPIMILQSTMVGPREVLLVAAKDTPITVRDAETGVLLRSMTQEFSGTIFSLLTHSNIVYSGCAVNKLQYFNLKDGQLLGDIECGVNITALKLVQDYIFASSSDGNIYVFCSKTHQQVGLMESVGKIVLSMEIYKNRQIIMSCSDGKVLATLLPSSIRNLIRVPH